MKKITTLLISICIVSAALAQNPQTPQQGPQTMKAAPQQPNLQAGPNTHKPALKKVYDENIDPFKQIDQAVSKAKREGKFVICQLGGNWCPWCLKFADFISKDREISKLLKQNFVYIHVNYNPKQALSKDRTTVERSQKLLKRLNNAGRFGYPVFVILNGKGKVIHIQDSSFLEEGESYDRAKVLRFFKNWTPAATQL